MLEFTPSQRTLLTILGDGACHSGNELGQALDVSRSAIWKQINQLIAQGIPVTRIAHQGYQLANPFILLNHEQIAAQLNELNIPFNLHVSTSIDSTNRYLKELPASSSLEICCAEVQTQGRGRFGRHWHSPLAENIYCSTRWTFNCELSRLSGLSLVSSLAVLATIKEFHNSSAVKIKWPNDILWHDKKLCGSLIEIIAESNGNTQVIIGVGLNVNTDTLNQPLQESSWCSLYEISGKKYNRNHLIARLISNLNHYLSVFMQHDLLYFTDEWNGADYLIGKSITVRQATGTISGVAGGIDAAGLLILEDDQGIKHLLSSGDTTLKQAESE